MTPVHVEPEGPRWYYRHSTRIERGPLPWVVASGAEGLETITLTVAPKEKSETVPARPPSAHAYTVRLYFAELPGTRPGERVFDVLLEGQRVLKNFDIQHAAGQTNAGIVREFSGIRIASELTIRLEAKKGRSLLSGIELIADD